MTLAAPLPKCANDYGAALSTSLPNLGVSTKYLGYVKGDLNLIIGFDEHDLSELNIYSKLARDGDFNADEQKALLNRMKDKSSWEISDVPYTWVRADGGGLAIYVALKSGW